MKTLKNYLIIALMFLMVFATDKCQSQDKRFTVFTYTDPVATYKDGFNIGIGIDYQMTLIYIKTQVFVFPDLRGKKYIEATGSIGFNQHFGMDSWRTYQGIKVGLIQRDAPHATAGLEIGLDYYFNGFNNGLYVGIGGSYDYRLDGQEEDTSIKPYWRESGLIKVGVTF